jgi:hypothetical protein
MNAVEYNMKAMSRLIRHSLALGTLLLAAVLSLGGTFAYAEALDTPSPAVQPATLDGHANVAERPDALFCVTYAGGDQTCIVEAQLEALYESEAGDAEHSPSLIIDAAPTATEDLPPTTYSVDAIVVEITQTVTVVVPGQDVEENEEPAYTGSVSTELNTAPEAETPALGIAGAN